MMRVRKTRLAAAAASLTLLAGGAVAMAAATPPPDTSSTGGWKFVSAPNLHPPKLHVSTSHKGLAPGLFFVSNFKNILKTQPFSGQGGPLIVDSHGQPVWFLPVNGVFANNLREQVYNGKPALSWWQGVVTSTGATTQGTDYVVDQRYHKVATLTAPAPWVITQHEMIIQGHDAWVTANSQPEQFQGHTIVDSAVQEYDLTSGKLLYSWNASDHIPLSASHQTAPPSPAIPWDAYHVNSIQLVAGGFVVSMRDTWSAYRVDKATSQIVWTLDGSGAGGSFKLPANGHFAWQHDVELHSNGLVSIFDDECCGLAWTPTPHLDLTTAKPSRGLLLQIDTKAGTASYVHQYPHPAVGGQAVVTAFQGNMQLLPNKNVVIGWGSAPFYSEFSYSGKLLYDVQMPNPDVTYRAYVFNWVGKPPLSFMRQAAKKSHGKTTVYASWDGATQIAAWRLLAGSSAKHLTGVSTTRKTSFETVIHVKGSFKTYKVQALDVRGHVLGTSQAFSTASNSSTVCNPVCGGY